MRKKGFSLVEILIILLVTSVLIAITMPVLTTKNRNLGFDTQVLKCVNIDLVSNPSLDISSTACSSSANNCCASVTSGFAGSSATLNNLKYLAETGANQDNARKIFKEICDRGGTEACKFLVTSCIKNSSLCDITSGFANSFDMHYYLNLANTNTNVGRSNVKSLVCGFYKTLMGNISNDVNTTCAGSATSTACDIKNNGTCNVAISTAIQNCNANTTSPDCTTAHNNSWNRSCKQIKTVWSDATDGPYTLTYNSSGVQGYKAYCDMTTRGGGWTLTFNEVYSVFNETATGVTNLTCFTENCINKAYSTVPATSDVMLDSNEDSNIVGSNQEIRAIVADIYQGKNQTIKQMFTGGTMVRIEKQDASNLSYTLKSGYTMPTSDYYEIMQTSSSNRLVFYDDEIGVFEIGGSDFAGGWWNVAGWKGNPSFGFWPYNFRVWVR